MKISSTLGTVRILLWAIILPIFCGQLGCSVSTHDVRPKPIGLLIDSIGGIYWARAPVGYYSGEGANLIRSYTKSIGLEDAESPLFVVDQEILTRIFSGLPSFDQSAGRGNMGFVFTFFFSDTKHIKRVIGKHELNKAIGMLPADITGRLNAMFEVDDKANNLGKRFDPAR